MIGCIRDRQLRNTKGRIFGALEKRYLSADAKSNWAEREAEEMRLKMKSRAES